MSLVFCFNPHKKVLMRYSMLKRIPSCTYSALSYNQGPGFWGEDASSLPNNGVRFRGSSNHNLRMDARRPKQRSRSIAGNWPLFTNLKQQSSNDLSTATEQDNSHSSTNTDSSFSQSPEAKGTTNSTLLQNLSKSLHI